MKYKKAVIILSGGMDSTTLLYDIINQGYFVRALSFNYGQRHKIELKKASVTCKKLNINHKIIDLTSITQLIQGSALTDNIDIPEGHYEQDNMKLTVVPNRNLIMGNLALAYALNINASKIFLGIHGGDHRIYEDCRSQALNSLNENAYIWDSDNRGELIPSWVRAFWEAEGSFNVNGEGYPEVLFSQNDKSLLEELKKFFYGRGCVYSKGIHIKKSGETGNESFNYKLSCQDCRLFIDLIDNGKLLLLKKRKIQYAKWYKKHKEYFERKPGLNHGQGKKTYNIQNIKFEAPYLYLDKGKIVEKGIKLKVDYSLTHTCYKGNKLACGKCGSCTERLEAFQKVKITDPIEYE